MENYTICEGTRVGSRVLIFNNKAYVKDKRSHSGALYYKCRKFKSCQGRGVLRDGQFSVTPDSDHQCDDDAAAMRKLRFVSTLKAESANSTADFRELYNLQLADPEMAAAAAQVPFVSICQSMAYGRNKNYPKKIKTPQEVVDWFETNRTSARSANYHASVEIFHRGQLERGVIFVHPALMAIVKDDHGHYFMDGTFAVCPPGFSQVLTVAVDLNGLIVSPAMALMTSRCHELYEAILKRLKEDFPQLCPTHVHSDFEFSILNASGKIFPGCENCGCSFHFRNAISRQMRRDHVMYAAVRHNSMANEIYRCYLSLPFLPPEDIPSAVIIIGKKLRIIEQDHVRKQFRLFHLQYIVGFWIKKVRPERFSTFGKAFKTNNPCEAINAQMKKLIPCHSRVFKFVDKLSRHVFEAQLANYENFSQSRNTGRRKSPAQQKAEEHLSKLEQKYLSGDQEFRLEQYLNALAGTFTSFEVKSQDHGRTDPDYENYLEFLENQELGEVYLANNGLEEIDTTEMEEQDEAENLLQQAQEERDRLAEKKKICYICRGIEPDDGHGIVLPCLHHGCLTCLNQLMLNGATCGMCRGVIDSVRKLPDEQTQRVRDIMGTPAAEPDSQPPQVTRQGSTRGPGRPSVRRTRTAGRVTRNQRQRRQAQAANDDEDSDDEVIFNN